jgi:hypothetical protein
MADDITIAMDEAAATRLIHIAETAMGTQCTPPTDSSLGPFSIHIKACASFSDGSVSLRPPNIIALDNCNFNYSLQDLKLKVDLNDILPPLCLGPVCIPTPFGDICTPRICLDWPTVPVPVPTISDTITFSAEFIPKVYLDGTIWTVDIVIVGIPKLELGVAAEAILAAIALAAPPILSLIP